MSQVSTKIRRCSRGYAHWCPGCGKIHVLPSSWSFVNKDAADALTRPTFTPSFKHTGKQAIVDAHGRWTGEYKRDAAGKPLDDVCHYIVTDGVLNYCADCVHDLKGQSVSMPDLPDFLTDEDFP